MKYIVRCYNCMTKIDISVDDEPKCCLNCGSEDITVIEATGKGRENAEKVMANLSQLRPVLDKATEEYQNILKEYRQELLKLSQYYSRGVVSRGELEKYNIKRGSPNYGNRSKGARGLPENWQEIREKVINKEMKVVEACEILNISLATWYNWCKKYDSEFRP